MNAKYIIMGIILAVIIILLGIFTFYNNDPCKSITDTSQQAECYMQQAVATGDITYCTVNYYTQKCLEKADPTYNAPKQDAISVCQKVVDTSKRNECLQYVNTNY